jgi:hypothetical protein
MLRQMQQPHFRRLADGRKAISCSVTSAPGRDCSNSSGRMRWPDTFRHNLTLGDQREVLTAFQHSLQGCKVG